MNLKKLAVFLVMLTNISVAGAETNSISIMQSIGAKCGSDSAWINGVNFVIDVGGHPVLSGSNLVNKYYDSGVPTWPENYLSDEFMAPLRARASSAIEADYYCYSKIGAFLKLESLGDSAVNALASQFGEDSRKDILNNNTNGFEDTEKRIDLALRCLGVAPESFSFYQDKVESPVLLNDILNQAKKANATIVFEDRHILTMYQYVLANAKTAPVTCNDISAISASVTDKLIRANNQVISKASQLSF